MRTIADAIMEFMLDYDTEYVNPHEVCICINTDGSFSVACSLEDVDLGESVAVELSYAGEELEDFIEAFRVKAVKDLGKIKRAHLWDLYQQGRGVVFCDLGQDQTSLSYRKEREFIIVYAEERVIDSLRLELHTSKEFIEQSKKYDRLI